MRKPWIAIAIIALVVGLAAGYRIGRHGNPPQSSARADREPETPIEKTSREDAPTSRQAAPARRATSRGDETSPTIVSEREPASTHRDVAPPPPVTAPINGAVASNAPVPIAKVAPTAAPAVAPSRGPAVPYPAAAAAETVAPQQELAEGTGTSAPADDPESDRHAPVLQYLRFDPPEIKGGEATMLSIGATDDLSGVKFVFGTVRSPSGTASVPFNARDAAGGGVFTATVAIPRQAETGDWFVATLQLVDKADNPVNLPFARATVPPGGALRVDSDASDSAAPNVLRVSLVKGSVGAGEKNVIVVDVDDEGSGVASVAGAFQSPSKTAVIPFTCTSNGGASSWEGDVPVPANADCGEWTLQQLRVTDKANNSSFLSMDAPQLGRVSFVVSGGGVCDSEPPSIDALSFAPTSVPNTAAATITVTITAHDDGSGVASLSGWVEGPASVSGQAPRIFFACTPDPADPAAPMIARVSIPQYAAKGVWRVSLIQVMDKARNTRSYNRDDPALVDAGFTVE